MRLANDCTEGKEMYLDREYDMVSKVNDGEQKYHRKKTKESTIGRE